MLSLPVGVDLLLMEDTEEINGSIVEHQSGGNVEPPNGGMSLPGFTYDVRHVIHQGMRRNDHPLEYLVPKNGNAGVYSSVE